MCVVGTLLRLLDVVSFFSKAGGPLLFLFWQITRGKIEFCLAISSLASLQARTLTLTLHVFLHMEYSGYGDVLT